MPSCVARGCERAVHVLSTLRRDPEWKRTLYMMAHRCALGNWGNDPITIVQLPLPLALRNHSLLELVSYKAEKCRSSGWGGKATCWRLRFVSTCRGNYNGNQRSHWFQNPFAAPIMETRGFIEFHCVRGAYNGDHGVSLGPESVRGTYNGDQGSHWVQHPFAALIMETRGLTGSRIRSRHL